MEEKEEGKKEEGKIERCMLKRKRCTAEYIEGTREGE